jgi:hypothetical protein
MAAALLLLGDTPALSVNSLFDAFLRLIDCATTQYRKDDLSVSEEVLNETRRGSTLSMAKLASVSVHRVEVITAP